MTPPKHVPDNTVGPAAVVRWVAMVCVSGLGAC